MPYVGGKQTMADQIVSLMAPHDHYVEPFFGGGSVLMAKPPSMMETVNDIDGDLVTFWRMLRDRPKDLAWVCAMTPHSRAEHRAAQDLTDCGDLEVARRVWVQLTQGRGGRRTSTGWRYVVTNSTSTYGLTDYLTSYLERILDCAERLQRVSLECRDAMDVIAIYDSADACLYVDPPYLGSTRGRNTLYAREMPNADEHARMLDALLACRGQVILSGYASPLYDEALTTWERIEVGARDQASRDRVEVLWINRLPHPTLLESA